MRHGSQEFVGRKNSVGANQAANLKDQRIEGGEVDQAERAQENPARNQALAKAVFRVEEPADDGARRPVHRGRIIPTRSAQCLARYSFVQVAPPSEVFQRAPASVVTTPCRASLNRMETIVPVSTLGGAASCSLFQVWPPSVGLEEHTTATASPDVIADDRHSAKLGGLIGEDRRPVPETSSARDAVGSDAPLPWRHDSRQEAHLRFLRSRLRSQGQGRGLWGSPATKEILSWTHGQRRLVLQNSGVGEGGPGGFAWPFLQAQMGACPAALGTSTLNMSERSLDSCARGRLR